MVSLSGFVRAWYWRGTELRECIVLEAGIGGEVHRTVLDAETLQVADAPPEDVMIEEPERL